MCTPEKSKNNEINTGPKSDENATNLIIYPKYLRGEKVSERNNNIIKRYIQVKSLKKISKEFALSAKRISVILDHAGIKKNPSKKYSCEHDYFEKINSEAKAYLFGFLCADGYVANKKNRKRVVLKIHSKDIEILHLFKNEIKATHPIHTESKTHYVLLSIDSAKMTRDLINHGCVCNKSLILKFPNIPIDLFNHFIRGYFDGDGCISLKDGDPRVSFNGTKDFLNKLHKILKTKCDLGRAKLRKDGNIYERAYGERLQVLRIKEYLYHNAVMYLKRKKDRFDLCDPSISFLNKTFCDDSSTIINNLPVNSIDLVVTSPPYNLSINYDLYKDKQPYYKYIEWLKSIFRGIYKKLKPGGRCAIIIGEPGNGKIPTHADICNFMTKELHYLPITTLIWKKNNVSNRQSWGSFASPLCPSFPTPFEFILIFAKKSRRLLCNFETDLTKQEFIDWSLSLWELPRSSYDQCTQIIKEGIHPAPMPEDIATRCIKMLSWVGATVLDPFMGIGTVPIACKKLNRNYIGVDISPNYVEYAEKRLKYAIISYNLFE